MTDNWPGFLNTYQTYLIDVWGVLIDGVQVYPKALDLLKYLGENGKQRILMSNTPLRSTALADKLEKIGITADFYDGMCTSGDMVHQSLPKLAGFSTFKQYYYIGEQETFSLLKHTQFSHCTVLRQADFVLLTGVGGNSFDKNYILEQAIESHLPMVCCNPDKSIRRLNGKQYDCAGSVAELYENMGGQVFYFGKPYIAFYQFVSHHFNIKQSEALAIGDSLATDIQGAINFSVDSLLVNVSYKPEGNKTSPTYHLVCFT